jgi:hypothetical protein
MSTQPRVIHFVTGGGSGATKVALDVACGHLRSGKYEPLLVMRRKKVALPAAQQKQIEAAGLRTAWVDDWPKWTTRRQLAALIADFKPQVFAAHGFSEHIWGRQAAFAAGVPVVVHIEQNCERYAIWRLWAARPLTARKAWPTTYADSVWSALAWKSSTTRWMSSASAPVLRRLTDAARTSSWPRASPGKRTNPP